MIGIGTAKKIGCCALIALSFGLVMLNSTCSNDGGNFGSGDSSSLRTIDEFAFMIEPIESKIDDIDGRLDTIEHKIDAIRDFEINTMDRVIGVIDPKIDALDPEVQLKVQVWEMAQYFVKKRLELRAANFGELFDEYQNPRHIVTNLGGKKFRVRAWFDEQDSSIPDVAFRWHFVCELEDRRIPAKSFLDPDDWRCTRLEIVGEDEPKRIKGR